MKSQTYTVTDFNAQLESGAFAWPGGYPLYFVMYDGEVMSFAYAKANADLIRESIASNATDDWRVIGCEVNWEDASLYCCGNNQRIESAYAEDEAKAN